MQKKSGDGLREGGKQQESGEACINDRPAGLRSNRLPQARGHHPAGLIGRRIRPKVSKAQVLSCAHVQISNEPI
ncbi:MAG: hypothetical protein ACR2PB_00105 [Desulfocapsaceae bacterium]